MMIDSKSLAKRLGVSQAHLVGVIRHRAGFPKPVGIFKRPLMWRSDDIDNFDGGV